MTAYKRGDVVIVPFPFSERDGSKVRPALVMASVAYGSRVDYLLCVITSQKPADPNLLELEAADVSGSGLKRKSYLRPTYLYTTGEARISGKVGVLAKPKVDAAIQALVGGLTR